MSRPRSVLEERAPRVPIGGKIHPGVKVLTREFASNQKAVEIFTQGMAKGMKYDAIERQIVEALGLKKSPLTPRNIPYFRITRADFQHPENADRLLELHGEDRNDGNGRQLYRFPLVFAFDDWLRNLEHKFEAHNRSGIQFWSEYDPTGERLCMTYPSAEVHTQNQRAKRLWGGRTPVVRGKCLPEKCPQYQAGECKLRGKLLFYVPGLSGSSMIEMGSSSIYSMQQQRSQMELVAGMRAGRLAGTYLGQPFFWLTKTQQQVSRINDKGNAERVKQHLVYLDAKVDMSEVMAGTERALAGPAPTAAAALPGPAIDGDATPPPLSARDAHERKLRLRAEIADILAKRGKDAEAFGFDMSALHGVNWSRDIDKLTLVLEELRKQEPGAAADGEEDPF